MQVNVVSTQGNQNQTVTRYLATKGRKTARDYGKRLRHFSGFIAEKYNLTLDELIKTMTTQGKGPKIDVYDLLQDYLIYLQQSSRMSALSLRFMISTKKGEQDNSSRPT